MNVEYCFKCGFKAEFTAQRPKFCPGCGEGFNTSVASVNTPKVSHSPDPIRKDTDELDASDIELLKEKAAGSINCSVEQHRVTIGDLSAPSSDSRRYADLPSRPDNTKGLEGRDFISEGIRECGRTRESKSIGGD